MNRSILVIDTPESCCSCYLRGFTLNLQYCRGKLKDIKDVSTKPDWCPLKLLPEKDTKNHFPDEFEDGYAAGWNGCIDEIGGGK